MQAGTAIGIDLGTTYSAVAAVGASGAPELLTNREGERLTPSVVFFDRDQAVVGRIARRSAAEQPERAIQFVKRQMGSAAWFVEHRGERLSPAAVSAIILGRLKADAEERLGHACTHAVITVPAYFDDLRRRETLHAGERAGLTVLSLVNEPTAAAVAYGAGRTGQPELLLVYDLGGGTFDITLLRARGGEIEVLGSDGDPQLGGKDFDDAIIGRAAARFAQEYGFDPTADPQDAWELREEVERVKHDLSVRTQALVAVRAQGRLSRFMFRREEFEALIEPPLWRTLALVDETLRQVGVPADRLDRVLLVGGSTRIPLVRAKLTEHLGRAPETALNPDESVALGAALLAARRYAELPTTAVEPPVAAVIAGIRVRDVLSHTIRVQATAIDGGAPVASLLIRRNTPLPAEAVRLFETELADQTAIRLVILQGEHDDPALCTPIGEFTLGALPPGRPRGCPVRVTVGCDQDGVVRVQAQDVATGAQATTTVSYNSGRPPPLSVRARWGNRP